MIIAQILTPWIGDGLSVETAYCPQITDDYPAISNYTDATGQSAAQIMPAPNLFVGEFIMTDDLMLQIEADSNYFVLWSENG